MGIQERLLYGTAELEAHLERSGWVSKLESEMKLELMAEAAAEHEAVEAGHEVAVAGRWV